MAKNVLNEEYESYPHMVDLHSLKILIDEHVAKFPAIFEDLGLSQEDYVFEEMGELIEACLSFMKISSKFKRKKVKKEEVFEEGVDVLTTLLLFFVYQKMPLDDILPTIEAKLKRALQGRI